MNCSVMQVNRALKPMLDAYFPQSTGVSVIAEPGAYYVYAAFSLAVSVISKKMAAQDAKHHVHGQCCAKFYCNSLFIIICTACFVHKIGGG